MSDVQEAPEWIGSLPRHWRLTPVGTLFDERKESVSDSEFPALSVTKGGVVPQLSDVAKSQNGDARKLVRAGDFVINSRSDRKGSSGISELDGSVSVVYTVLRPREGLELNFAHHLLRSSAFQEEFYRWGSGIVADLWSTRYSAMKRIALPIPPLDEQRDIADYLDRETQKIDELITEQRGLIETLRERRQAVTYELVSGLNLEIERWNTGSFIFPSLPNGWKAVSLRRVGKSKSGSGFPPSAQGMTGEDLQFFKVKHLGQADPRDVVHYADDTITRETAKRLGAQIFPPGTIAYAKVGAALMLGRIRTLGSEGCMDNNMAGFILSEGVESRFLQLAMSCIPFDYLVNPGAVPSLSDKNLMAMKIPLPPMDVQRKVSGEVDAQTSHIDELIAESEDLIALSQERRTALITAAVTGQIDVRTAA